MEILLKISAKRLYQLIFRLMFVLMIAVALIASQQYSVWVIPAYSQVKQPKKRTNVFDLLFGKRGSLRTPFRINRGKRIKLRRNDILRPGRKTLTPVVVVEEKREDALKILVAGDFMAGALAWGMEQAFIENSDVVIVDISKGLSGFVRNDVKDWPGDIAFHIDEIKPAAVVILGGMNDRQQMALEGGKVKKLGEPWLAAYNSRTEKLAKTVREKNLPLIWVGLPPVKSGKMTTDYLVFNEIYRTRAEAVNGVFVNIWDGFTNEEGHFVSAGPDINGQIKRLRTSDGINMTKTGKRKLAFYVNKAIRKLTGIGTKALLVSLPGIENPKTALPQYDPAKTGKTIVYSFASPALDGGSELEGDGVDLKEEEAKKSVSYQLVNGGILPKTHPGRIDHYGVTANEAPPTTDETPALVDKHKDGDTKVLTKPVVPRS